MSVDQWADKSVTTAAFFNYENKALFEVLPYPTYQIDDIDLRTNLIYEHLKLQYFWRNKHLLTILTNTQMQDELKNSF